MADTNIFSFIGNEYYHLTASEKKVADYVQAHRAEVQFLSISELAEACGVADATVSRFCRRMKLRGYSEFRLEVAKAEAEVKHRTAAHSDVGGNDGDIAQTVSEVFNSNVHAIRQSMDRINPETVEKTVDLISAAKHIYCMGQGGSMILASETAHLFSTVCSKFYSISDSHTQMTRAALFDESDLLFFFSYSGSTKEMVDIIQLARSRGAKVILMTRFLKSPGAGLSDIILQCGSDEGPLQMGSIPARMAQLYIVDVLFHEFCRRDSEIIERNREFIVESLSAKHL